MTPVALLAALVRSMVGSSLRPAEARVSTPAHPVLAVSDLNRLVINECQAMIGTMASTRQSIAAVTNWMPPP